MGKGWGREPGMSSDNSEEELGVVSSLGLAKGDVDVDVSRGDGLAVNGSAVPLLEAKIF